ncbi:MAG TPA: SUF system NifU family Fe-S cluster assembly protein [Dokdonella sp.]
MSAGDAPTSAAGAHALYRDLVLEHKRRPRNFGTLTPHTHAADGVNALCGDRLRIELDCRAGRVLAVRFSGESCAIATASASMLSEHVVGLDAAAIADAAARFARLIEGEVDADASLGELQALGELRDHAARRKCALLPWATLAAALDGREHATTEASDRASVPGAAAPD